MVENIDDTGTDEEIEDLSPGDGTEQSGETSELEADDLEEKVAPEGEKDGGLGDASDWEDAFKEITETPEELTGPPEKEAIKEGDVSPHEFSELEEKEAPPVRKDLDFVLDIPLDVTAELGRTKLVINDLLRLTQGSIIELSKADGDPVEIFVNGKLVARGEVVVVNDKFGVRLSDIISPTERVKRLA